MKRRTEPEFIDLAHEAEAYAHADFSEVNEAFVERLTELAPAAEALTIDLGTGASDIPVRLLRRRPRWRIVAVDASSAMLAFAIEKLEEQDLSSNIALALVDAKNTPFADRTVDVVFSNSILHHLTDTAAFWRETARIAKGGAVIFLRDLARPATEQEAHRIVNRHAYNETALLQQEYYRSLLASWTPDEIREQLREAGLPGLKAEMVDDRHFDVSGSLPD